MTNRLTYGEARYATKRNFFHFRATIFGGSSRDETFKIISFLHNITKFYIPVDIASIVKLSTIVNDRKKASAYEADSRAVKF